MKKIYETTYIVIGCVVLIAWLLIQFVYMPMLNDAKALKKTLDQHRERNMRIKQLAEKPDFFPELNSKIFEYHEEIKKMLPRPMKLSSLLRELSVLARQSSVNIISIKPIEREQIDVTLGVDAVVEKPYETSKIQIYLECGYANFGQYIQSVENNDLTTMAVKNVTLNLDKENKNPQNLEGVLTVEAYYLAT